MVMDHPYGGKFCPSKDSHSQGFAYDTRNIYVGGSMAV